jgi:hypothetical protein
LETVAALRSFPALKSLVLNVGTGTLLPQLTSLASLQDFYINYYCLRGSIPARLLGGMPRLERPTIKSVATAFGAADPAGGLCGISGTLPSVSSELMTHLDLSYNQLTGQLPSSLLSLASWIDLQNNKFSGSIPGYQAIPLDAPLGVHAKQVASIDLSNNALEASCS